MDRHVTATTSPGRSSRRPAPALLLLLAALWAGCGQEPAVRPLLGDGRAPEVLAESGVLAPPSSREPNRFGPGWAARKNAGRLVLVPAAPASRIELIYLGEEVARMLTLELAALAPGAESAVRVRSGDRDLGRLPLARPFRLRLPEDIPVGRVPIELSFESWQRGTPEVLGGSVSPILPAGSARAAGRDLLQWGNSIVYLAAKVRRGDRLVGAFVPPVAPRRGQRFELTAERRDGTPIRRFYWSPSPWDRLRATREIDLPLRDAAGAIRVRLLSRGDGPAGRWQRLGLAGDTGKPVSPGLG